MDEETGCFVYSQYEYEDLDEHGKDGLIPLYTYQQITPSVLLGASEPVYPVKELTDEEILEIASPMFEDTRYPSTALDFARAILRKAQEK